MTIKVKWNSRSKIFIESFFEDPWSLEEFVEARKAWYRMIKSVDYRVPILLDLRESQEAPPGMLRQFGAVYRAPHPRQGHVYVMGRDSIYYKLRSCFQEDLTDPDKSVRFIESIDCIISPE